MNERSWLGATRPYPMLDYLGERASARKLRLLGIAAAYRLRAKLSDRWSWKAIEVAEAFVEGHAGVADLQAALDELGRRPPHLWDVGVSERVAAIPDFYHADHVFGSCGSLAQNRGERVAHCDLVREIFGNPFRTVAFNPSWRTDTALSLARVMYDSRDYTAMPILADALQDAGCEHAYILDHCRDPKGVHVRGCWVVDLVLGK